MIVGAAILRTTSRMDSPLEYPPPATPRISFWNFRIQQTTSSSVRPCVTRPKIRYTDSERFSGCASRDSFVMRFLLNSRLRTHGFDVIEQLFD